jgi:hypothetical protein
MTKKVFVKGVDPVGLVFNKAIKKPIPISVSRVMSEFEVQTLEGTMQGKAGDYLMVGVNGEMYPCDFEIFVKTYDLVES